jgi:hypothetical protein
MAERGVMFVKFPGMTPTPKRPLKYCVALVGSEPLKAPMIAVGIVTPVVPNVRLSSPYSAYAVFPSW